nr:MAG TPA: hypothetical protein [Caudoviricetes sp.]
MLKMVDGTGIIGVDMICPLGVSTPQPPNYDRVEMEGTGILVLPNSLDAQLERLELGGKTEQVQTSGKNLFDESKNEKGYYTGGLGTVSSLKKFNGWSWNSPLNVIQNTTLSVSVVAKIKSRFQVILADDLNTVLYVNSKYSASSAEYTHSFNAVEGTTKILISVYEETSPEGVTIMLNEGVVSIPYEPYTGGKPSPSPEYPQEIKNSGKWNEEKQKYEVDVKITEKNLLNLQKEPDVKGVYQGWKVGNGESLTLGVKDKGNNADIKGCYIGFSYQGSDSKGAIWVVDNGVIKADPLTQRKAYVSIYPNNETTVKKLTERLDIQCELGNVATPYQPYKEQTITITSDRPITKWDKLVEQGGEIGWLYSTGVYEDIKESDISANSINDQYGRYYVNAIKAYKNAECMCNIAEYSPAQKENKCGFWWSDTLCFLISSEYTGNNGTEDNSTAIKNFKDNVLSKGITVFYKLNTEEFVPLPQSEQNAIRALKTYYPTTVITVDGGELDPDIKVTYRKEI